MVRISMQTLKELVSPEALLSTLVLVSNLVVKDSAQVFILLNNLYWVPLVARVC